MNHYPILFISLGPGDPELITLKGWKALQAADIVFCPETEGRNGERTSRAANIVRRLGRRPHPPLPATHEQTA